MRHRGRPRGIAFVAVLVGAFVALIVTPLGSSSNAKKLDGIAQAKAFVKKYSAAPTSIGISKPLSKRPPTGKRIYWLECGVPVCHTHSHYLQLAAKVLGWKLTIVPMGTTPEEIGRAWTRAAEDLPDAVIATGVPQVLFKAQLAKLWSHKIPYAAGTSTDPNTNGQIADIADISDFKLRGVMAANWTVADTDGKANVVFVNVPDFPVLRVMYSAFASEFKRLCPSCKQAQLKVSATDIGKKMPSIMVSYLQAHPDTDYIVYSFGDLAIGVTQALVSGGFQGKVKSYSDAGSPVNRQDIVNGKIQVVDTGANEAMLTWRVMDVLARWFDGDPVSCCNTGVLPKQYLTKANITDPKANWFGPKNYQAQFKKLWHIP